MIPAETSPVPRGLSGCLFVLTQSAVRGSMVLPGNPPPPWLLPHSVPLPTEVENPQQKKKEKNVGNTHPAPKDTLLVLVPSTSPKQPANLNNSQPLWSTLLVRTSPRSVQQCPQQPLVTAFPHPRRLTADPRRKHTSQSRAYELSARLHLRYTCSDSQMRGDSAPWWTPVVREQQGRDYRRYGRDQMINSGRKNGNLIKNK